MKNVVTNNQSPRGANMNTKMKTALIACAMTCVAASSQARDAIGPGDRDNLWVLGAGGVVFTNVYRGEDQFGSVFPNIRYNGDRFFVKDATLNLSLAGIGGFSSGLTIVPDSSFLSDEDEYRDNAQLAGLTERDATIEGGIYINHDSALGRATLRVLSDLGNEHDGQAVSMSYTFDLKLGNWCINPTLGVQWMRDRKVAHHYGVSAEEATDGRDEYSPGSAFNAFASIRGRYEFSEHWDVELQAGASVLDSSITNSSIVDEDVLTFGGLSINYNF